MRLSEIFWPWGCLKEAKLVIGDLGVALAAERVAKAAVSTELLQTRRAGYADLALRLGVSVEDIMHGKIEPMLHDDPQAVYRALDNAQASEIKFRQVKTVNWELRSVIRQIIDGIGQIGQIIKLPGEVNAVLGAAEEYAARRPAGGTPLGFEGGMKELEPPTRGANDGTSTSEETEEQPEGAAKAPPGQKSLPGQEPV